MTETLCMAPRPEGLELPWCRRDVRAPGHDGELLSLPELSEAANWVSLNQQALARSTLQIGGRPLADLRHWSRQVLGELAEACTARLEAGTEAGSAGVTATRKGARENVRPAMSAESRWLVTGHQPVLFHPGVWVKNFAVGQLSRQLGAVGLNLIVDNDLLTTTAIRIPRGPGERPHVETVLFDLPQPVQPWEEVRVRDRALFESFAERVAEPLREWQISPIVREYWAGVRAYAEGRESGRRKAESGGSSRAEPQLPGCFDTGGISLTECLAAGRHAWERERGVENWELPLSAVCDSAPFLWFAVGVLSRVEEFQAVHNQVLREYRDVNRVRSRTHPVADLRQQDGWCEAPFWIWRAGARQRQRVFVQRRNGELTLADGQQVFATLPAGCERDASAAVSVLRELAGQGIRFRTRALTTTLFARLCLADLFVHGIGGAKYDEMTDRLMARFFGVQPPPYMTLSATVRLPLPWHAVQPEDERRLLGQLRELEYHPERHLEGSGQPVTAHVQSLIAEKQTLIAEQQRVRSRSTTASHPVPTEPATRPATPPLSRGVRPGLQRLQRLQEINRLLSQETCELRQALLAELEQTRALLAANRILRDRDYAAVLQPAERLQALLQTVADGIASRSA